MIKVEANLQVAPVDRRGSTGGLKVVAIILTIIMGCHRGGCYNHDNHWLLSSIIMSNLHF